MSNDISREGNQTYRISELAQLSLVESIRRRPAMYVGGVDEQGLLYTHQGCLDAINHECWDKSPVNYVIAAGHDRLQFACEEYEKSLDLMSELFVRDIPSVALNALSSVFLVAYRKGNDEWSAQYIRGDQSNSATWMPENFQRGIWWEALPDPHIFGDTKIDILALRSWLRQAVRTIPNLSIDFHDLETDTREYIACPEGMADTVTQMLEYHGLDRMAYPELIHLSDWTGDFRIDVAFSHHSFLNDHAVAAYCNGEHNAVGGAHVEGLLAGMADALNQFAEHERMVLQVSPENVLRGLLAGISIFIRQRPQILGEGPRREPNALFDDTIEATGQTITQSVHDFVHHKLFEYLRYEPGLGRAILAHVAA